MGVMRLCFLFFCLFLVSVSSVRKLNNIDDLKNTGYGRYEPRHGHQLLFWFALQVTVDQNNNIYLNFDPRQGHYGFHRFGNMEGVLPSSRSGQSYYEVGNLNTRYLQNTALLPHYVGRYYASTTVPERNMDRLIVSINQAQQNNQILSVFITAHNRGRNDFNSYDTYEINPDLIREIRQRYYCSDISEDERCNQFLEQTGYVKNNYCIQKDRQKRSPQCDASEVMKLQIKTNRKGFAKVIWKNLPVDRLSTKEQAYIYIFQITHSKDTDEDPTVVRRNKFQIDDLSGALDTCVPINAGLQPQLHLHTSLGYYYYSSEVLLYGPEFDGTNGVLPVRIPTFDASLQLYAEDRKACARLYIKKTFSDWKNDFSYSWVGFYKSSRDKNDEYYTYQYVVNFEMIDNTFTEDYDIYQYKSSLTIAPGVQIRLMQKKDYDSFLAKTTPWECKRELMSSAPQCKKETEMDFFSSESLPELYNEQQFCDANNVAPVQIGIHHAGLQLFAEDGKACARLFIKNNFHCWKDDFKNSWVGFYSSSWKENNDYDTYQYTVYFEKTNDVTRNFDIYQYKSGLTIAAGMHIRFLWGTDSEAVRTEYWSD